MDKRVEYSAVDGGGKGEMKRYRIGRIEWQGNRGREEGREGSFYFGCEYQCEYGDEDRGRICIWYMV